MRIGELERVVQTVQAVYSRVLASAGCKLDFHQNYQRFLVNLAWSFGYIGQAEFEVQEVRLDGRGGFIDVVWLDHKGKPILVIEVDSAARQKSLDKLGMVRDCTRLWIYYGSRESTALRARLDFPGDIHLVCLPYTGRHDFNGSARSTLPGSTL